MRARVERAYLGSLNRRVRNAACARLGVTAVLLLILHWGSRRSARGGIFGMRVAYPGTRPS